MYSKSPPLGYLLPIWFCKTFNNVYTLYYIVILLVILNIIIIIQCIFQIRLYTTIYIIYVVLQIREMGIDASHTYCSYKIFCNIHTCMYTSDNVISKVLK